MVKRIIIVAIVALLMSVGSHALISSSCISINMQKYGKIKLRLNDKSTDRESSTDTTPTAGIKVSDKSDTKVESVSGEAKASIFFGNLLNGALCAYVGYLLLDSIRIAVTASAPPS